MLTGGPAVSADELRQFHDKLYAAYLDEIGGNAVFRMKEWWFYAKCAFADPMAVHRAVRKARKVEGVRDGGRARVPHRAPGSRRAVPRVGGAGMEMTPIAHIETDLPQKFGIPRNSFLAPHLQGRIVFEPEFALPQAVAGLEELSHLWLLWEFENGTPGGTAADIAMDTVTASKPGTTAKWTPTVRPPRLGGSERRGVFCHAQSLSAQSHRSDLCEARPY